MMYYFVIKNIANQGLNRDAEFGVVADTKEEADAIFTELSESYRQNLAAADEPDLKSVQFGLQQRWQFAQVGK